MLLLVVAAAGLVMVLTNRPRAAACHTSDQREKEACWREQILGSLKRDGVAAAFDTLAVFYESDKTFASPCHDYTHRIGQTAYELFLASKSFEVTDKTAYCSFGFYHGFMESLLSRGGSIQEAQKFCTYIDEELKSRVPSIRFSCYHGIGHGSVDVHNTAFWGDEEGLTKEPLILCHQFATNDEQLKICSTGVFDSISTAYYNDQNGLVMREDDPLWLCKRQTEPIVAEACYMDMMPAMLWFAKYDIPKAIELTVRFTDAPYVKAALQELVSGSIRHVRDPVGVDRSIAACRRLADDLRLLCVSALGSGFMQFGPPEREYEEALAFCGSSTLAADEKDACFASVLSYVSDRYPSKKAQQICTTVGEPYRKYCNE
jgi:hypothetical protein